MNIDKLILVDATIIDAKRFGSLMNIDKLIQFDAFYEKVRRFGSLMNIDKLILRQILSLMGFINKSV